MRNLGLLALAILFPIFVYATALVNINTADATLLDTLPGIGPSKATAIIDYRTQHGLFARIEDIQNVSGIGPSTYAGLAPFITVGDMGTSTAPVTASSTPSATSSGGSIAYTPPPSVLSIKISSTQNVLLEVPLRLSARVTTKSGDIDSLAQISWSFGEGSSSSGSAVEKTYHYAGTYLITVDATDGAARARDEMIITVKPAKVRILSISGDGITIANDSNERLDLSGWRLLSDTGSFHIPDGMIILPNANVMFPFVVMNMPIALNTTLSYPNGGTAVRYSPQLIVAVATTSDPIPEQPSQVVASYRKVQAVEPIISVKKNIQAHEETVNAPAAATELAAAGATSASSSQNVGGFFRSPWTLGFLSLMTLAGGAFIFL